MELGGKGNAITSSTTTISTKTIEVKSDLALAPFPIKREHQKQKTRVDQAAKYKECLKNHAASKGGHVVDGCCEFMSGSEEELKCAACNCHRSFHRKEMYGDRKSNQELINPTFNCSNNSYKVMQRREIGHRTSSSSEDMKKILIHRNNVGGKGMIRKKKRVRTKIDDEQKEKMKEFAERLGWRMQKKDEEEIDKFCRMVNLRRQVFKVWMHNNKQAIKRMHNNTNDLQN